MSREKERMDIEELSITVSFPDRAPAESLTAQGFEVEVEFDYVKGYPEQIHGPAEDCEPGQPDEFDIRSVKLCKATPFNTEGMNLWLAKGYEVKGFFSAHEIEALEERLSERAQQGDTDV